jgi:hypothetical protein
MTAVAITRADASTGPGLAAVFPLSAGGGRALKAIAYDYDQGTDNYNTGGEDISSIFNEFTEVLWIGVTQKDTNTAADRRDLTIDFAAQKLLIYTAFNTEATASDQGVVAARILAIGY